MSSAGGAGEFFDDCFDSGLIEHFFNAQALFVEIIHLTIIVSEAKNCKIVVLRNFLVNPHAILTWGV